MSTNTAPAPVAVVSLEKDDSHRPMTYREIERHEAAAYVGHLMRAARRINGAARTLHARDIDAAHMALSVALA